MSPIPELLLRQIDRWCARCVPEHAREHVRVENKRRGRSVTLVERRAPWDPDSGEEWSELRVAQLRYGTDGKWLLFSPDRSGRWRPVRDAPGREFPGAVAGRDRPRRPRHLLGLTSSPGNTRPAVYSASGAHYATWIPKCRSSVR